MWDALRRLMAPPVFGGDEEQTRRAAVLNSLLWTFLILLAAYTILAVPIFVSRKAAALLLVAAFIGIWVGVRVLLHAGRIRLASIVWLAALWILSTFLALLGGGVRSPGAAMYLAIPLWAGLLLGRRGALAAFGICGLTLAGVAGLEATGHLPPQYFPYHPGDSWAFLMLVMAGTVIPLREAVGRLRRALAMAREQVVERTKMEAVATNRTQQLEVVQRVSAEITRELDLDRLLRLILQRAVELVKANGGTILFWDEAAQALVPMLYSENLSGLEWQKIPVGRGVVGRVAASRSGLIVNDYRTWPGAIATSLTRTGVTAAMAEPLLYRDTLVGVINVVQTAAAATFTDRDARFLRLFADQATIAIENARLYAAAGQAAREARSLYAVARGLTSTLDLSEALRLVAAQAVALLGTNYAQVVLYDEATGTLRFGAGHGPDAARCSQLHYEVGKGVAGIVADTRQPLVVNDYQAFPHRFAEFTNRVADLGVPLLYRDRLLGVLTTCSIQPGRQFTDHDRELLTAFAAQAAVAIENARLFDELKQSYGRLQSVAARAAEVEEAERRRLARELHDQVGQNLSALGLNLTMLQAQRGEATDAAFRSRLTDSLTLVERTGAAIRSVMADLRPGVLDDYGLVAALRWLGDEVAARTGIVVDVQGEECAPRLAAPVENCLFRIAQEALVNVTKHAQASEVTVSVEVENGVVRLLISDNGIGFDPARAGKPQGGYHWGLSAMAERALGIGGRCRIESRPGKGTHVIVEAPL